MPAGAERFSQRHGYRAKAREITVREDAPDNLRAAVILIGVEARLSYSTLREITCRVLREIPDPSNWSEIPNVRDEVLGHMQNCEWFKVYDIAEAIWQHLHRHPHRYSPESAERYQDSLNEFFEEKGIGWQMVDGQIVMRGEESFEATVSQAGEALSASGRMTAANEISEALQDLSRRPQADLTGAVQHGMAALECVARDVCGGSATLGDLMRRHSDRLGIPRPLDQAVEKLWGFASEMGRHIREGRTPDFEEAVLVVEVSAAICTYLVKKNSA